MENLVNPNPNFWLGKKVLLTGHTGFKGSWMTLWLKQLGAEVCGLALAPQTDPNLYSLIIGDTDCRSHLGDIRDATLVQKVIAEEQPQIVFHLAAQALVRASYTDPLGTYATNVQGTANLLDALREASTLKVVVGVTTDKVYANQEWAYPYRESDRLGGHDPYSASKAACELVIASYRDAFLRPQQVAVASARAGNVIGGGDWSPDRIIPDAIRAWQQGDTLQLRNPQAVRPWQHVLEPLAGYLLLAERLWQQPELAGPFNFGPHTHEAMSVGDLIQCAAIGDPTVNTEFCPKTETFHETDWLALEIAKARQALDWQPRWTSRQAIERTMAWYRVQQSSADARLLCTNDIRAYEQWCT